MPKAKSKRSRPGSRSPLHIPKAQPIEDRRLVRFSFEYLDTDGNPKFRLDACSQEYLRSLLTALRGLSTRTPSDLLAEWVDSYRAHRIDFDETTEPDGFSQLGEQLARDEAWQFSPDIQKEWRVHGLLIDDVFFVVWLDPSHKLYNKSIK